MVVIIIAMIVIMVMISIRTHIRYTDVVCVYTHITYVHTRTVSSFVHKCCSVGSSPSWGVDTINSNEGTRSQYELRPQLRHVSRSFFHRNWEEIWSDEWAFHSNSPLFWKKANNQILTSIIVNPHSEWWCLIPNYSVLNFLILGVEITDSCWSNAYNLYWWSPPNSSVVEGPFLVVTSLIYLIFGVHPYFWWLSH